MLPVSGLGDKHIAFISGAETNSLISTMDRDIPYGFDCYTFTHNELKYYKPDLLSAKSLGVINTENLTTEKIHESYTDPTSGINYPGFIKFTRKNEYYTNEQLNDLVKLGKVSGEEVEQGRQVFCGIKIQIGIGVVTNFLQRGLLYRKPNKGRGEFINGTWTGIVGGLSVARDAPNSYDIAFGNFLAYDEEFPYMKFGPFCAIESKLVMLTGSSRQVEASALGTNISREIFISVIMAMIALSLIASIRVHWEYTKIRTARNAIEQFLLENGVTALDSPLLFYKDDQSLEVEPPSLAVLIQDFLFIYFTMLLNKPCIEFEDKLWPKHRKENKLREEESEELVDTDTDTNSLAEEVIRGTSLSKEYRKIRRQDTGFIKLPTSIRLVSYLWSAACLVLASIYSGEMLAVILLHTDQNIDTVPQLIQSVPQIEPVIRQDDFTYNLMLKSLDKNLLTLHNKTQIIPRSEVYRSHFIEAISERKKALLGDDEIIETIYEIYHKYFPLYRSKVTYLQYPISIMYRMDLERELENQLRQGMVQIFEMGLMSRWYQAQKETLINFYDTYEKKEYASKDKELENLKAKSDHRYKPLSIQNFYSFFRLMLFCLVLAFTVLVLELIYYHCYEKKQLRTS